MRSKALSSLQGREDLQQLAVQADQQLRGVLTRELGGLFGQFLGKAGAALLSRAASRDGPADERKHQELARSLNQRADEWTNGFLGHVQLRVFMGDQTDDTDRDAEPRVSAGMIAMAKALLLAETQYSKRITEIDARVNRIRLIVDLPIDVKGLSPTGFHRALESTADGLQWPASNRDALFINFEQAFIGELDEFYAKVLQTFKDIGAQAARLVVDTPLLPAAKPDKAAVSGAAGPERKNWMQPPTDKLLVDDETLAMLTGKALSNDGDGYTDGLLAADLLALMDKRPLPGIAKDHGWIPVQRTSLAGHFLNEVKSDPLIPQGQDHKHEPLRMPLVKSALADSSVFTDESHPLASLISEHMTRAARHRLDDVEESEQMSESLHEILSLFDLAPDFVRSSMATAEPIQDAQIQRFYELQRKQAVQRKEFVMGEARRMVAEEMERSAFGRDIPPQAQRFLSKIWGALLTQRLLKFGASHPKWKEGIARADELIDLLEARNPKEAGSEEWIALVRGMSDDLIAGGLPTEQRSKLIMLLEAARKSS